MEDLTKKEEEVIELVMKGENKNDAVMKVFNCANRNVARVYASRLFKKEKVANRLMEASEKVNDKLSDNLAEETLSFIDLIKKHITMNELAEILVKGVRSNDKRVSDSCMEKLLRIISAYPKEELQTLGGSLFQLVMIGGKNGQKALESGREEDISTDMPIMIQEKESPDSAREDNELSREANDNTTKEI